MKNLALYVTFGYSVGMNTPRASRSRQRRGPRGEVADAIRQARAVRGLTQEQAAEELGISRVHLARIETGSRQPSGLAKRYLLEVWIQKAYGEQSAEKNR